MAAVSEIGAQEIRSAEPRGSIGRIAFPLLALLLTLVILASDRQGQPWSPEVSAVLALMVFSVHVALGWRRMNPLDPTLWIPFAMLLFYFALPAAMMLYGDGNPSGYDSWDLGLPRHLTQGFAMALLSLLAFLGGIHAVGLVPQAGDADPPSKRGPSLLFASFVVAALGLGMLLLGIVLVGPGRVFGAYSDLWFAKSRGLDVRLLGIGTLIAAGGVYGLLASHDFESRRSGRWLFTLFALGVAAVVGVYTMLTGDRGTMVSFAFAGGWVFSRSVRRLPWSFAVVAFLVGVVLLPAVKEYREYSDLRQTSSSSPRELLASNLSEMGQTHLVFGHTMDLIPQRKGYDWGVSYVYAILNSIPNPLPTAGKGFLPDKRQHAPGHWLTSTLNPIKYEQGGGYGYAMGAEWYFNFGLPGVLLGMLAVGALLTVVRNKAPSSPAYMLFSAALFQMLLATVRNAAGAHLKTALWPLVAILIVHGLLSLLGLSKSRATRPLTERPLAERPR